MKNDKEETSRVNNTNFLFVGFGNILLVNRIIMIMAPDSVASKRIRTKAKNEDKLIDLTMGRKIRSVILLDNDYIVLSAINTETLVSRLNKQA